jgi:predicted DNA-binding protein (UPF0251 family)
MWRRRKFRNIEWNPICTVFKPAWIPQRWIEMIVLWLDEYEAFRLADKESCSMQQWAEKMWISAPTFNRLLQSAHNKIADALVEWKAIKICTE